MGGNSIKTRRTGGDLWKLGGPAAFLVLAAFVSAYYFVDPAPPSRIVLATGEEGGAYALFGRAYRDRLAEFGIEVELRESAGSFESLEWLRVGEVDVAFAQGGLARESDGELLASLGSLYFEPLWVFHRAGLTPERLSDLAGLRLSIGPEGSGTRAVASELLGLNGVAGPFQAQSGADAVDSLVVGDLDAVFLTASPESPLVRDLLLADEIELFSFLRAAAYVRTHRYLSSVTLPEGMIDYARNIPNREVKLVAPAANLVIRADLHPALVDLLVQSAERIHRAGGVFEEPGAFPTPDFIDLPLNAEAQRFYANGPPFLQRYLPFWLATLVDRLKVMLIPLVALLIPVFRLVPPLYRWRVRSRIYRWYTELRDLDASNPLDLASDQALESAILEARRIEAEVAEVEAPASYAQELYDLRLHLEFVHRQLEERAKRVRTESPRGGEG